MAQLQSKLSEINQKFKDVSVPEIVHDSFVQRYTKFESFQALVDASGIQGLSETEMTSLSEFIKANTEFESWNDFYQAAFNQYFDDK